MRIRCSARLSAQPLQTLRTLRTTPPGQWAADRCVTTLVTLHCYCSVTTFETWADLFDCRAIYCAVWAAACTGNPDAITQLMFIFAMQMQTCISGRVTTNHHASVVPMVEPLARLPAQSSNSDPNRRALQNCSKQKECNQQYNLATKPFQTI